MNPTDVDLAELPAHWTMLPIKYIGRLVTGGTPATTEDEQHFSEAEDGFPWFRPEDLDATGRPSTASRYLSESGWATVPHLAPPSVHVVSIGATLGKVGYVEGLAASNQQINAVTGAQCPKFVFFALIASQDRILASSMGNTLPIISAGRLGAVKLPVPPQDEQVAIVAFLEDGTSKVDALIGKQQQLIATLRENRDALWSKFLDEAAVGTKSAKLRRVIDSIVDGPFGSSLTSAHYVDEGARVIRLGNIGINEFKDADRAYISLTYARELSAHKVVAGDVVIAGLGDERMPLGRAVVIPEIGPAIVKADCFRVRPSKGLAPEFLAWALSAPQTRNQIALLARGATRARLNTSVVGEVKIPLPPIDRQRQIIEQSRLQLAKIDALICKSTAVIETLREFRSALIADAVKGRIDVRGA